MKSAAEPLPRAIGAYPAEISRTHAEDGFQRLGGIYRLLRLTTGDADQSHGKLGRC